VKPQEIRVLETDELDGRLKSSRRELYELRFKLAVGQLDDHRQIRKVRSDIARLLTFKRQRELGLLQDGAPVTATAVAPAASAMAEPVPESVAAPDAEIETENEEQE
jgi:large subunit ribosomal protein L29